MAFTSAKYLDASRTQIAAIRDDGETVVLSAVPGLLAYDELIASGVPISQAVPQSVTPYQARVALNNAGLLDAVNAVMQEPTTPANAKIAWDYAVIFERNSAFISALAPALQLTDAQIDDLFIAAANVE